MQDFQTTRSTVHRITRSARYKKWRDRVVQRDLGACVLCGNPRGADADRLEPLHDYVQRKGLVTPEDIAEVRDELYDLAAGRTLCGRCRTKRARFRARARQADR